MKIAHLASYGINVGDNITIRNIRMELTHRIKEEIIWVDVPIADFHEQKNKVSYCESRFEQLSKQADALLIGGGGLIEGSFYNKYETDWKLPFNRRVLRAIHIPIFCHSLGFNYFWGHAELSKKGIEQLKWLVDRAKYFSLRNDGSMDIADSIMDVGKIVETSDPGMMMDLVLDRQYEQDAGLFQMAWNKKKSVNERRFRGQDNINELVNVVNDLNMRGIPHTPKDLSFPIDNWIRDKSWQQWQKLFSYSKFMDVVNWYRNADHVLAMRGHGQLITLGMNLPGIYLVTQPKVLGFSLCADMLPFTVDIRRRDWLSDLTDKLHRLQLRKAYRQDWYERRDKYMEKMQPCYDSFNSAIVEVL